MVPRTSPIVATGEYEPAALDTVNSPVLHNVKRGHGFDAYDVFKKAANAKQPRDHKLNRSGVMFDYITQCVTCVDIFTKASDYGARSTFGYPSSDSACCLSRVGDSLRSDHFVVWSL